MYLIPRYKTIGNRIRQLREIKGLSQAEFAKNIGISQRFVSNLEAGTMKPSQPLLLAIEYIYKCRIEWVISGDGEMWKLELDHPQIIDMEQVSCRQIRYWTDKLRRIFGEGNKNKINALRSQLRALDPREKKEELGGTEDAGVVPKSDTG